MHRKNWNFDSMRVKVVRVMKMLVFWVVMSCGLSDSVSEKHTVFIFRA
jgi:hypothetical protein